MGSNTFFAAAVGAGCILIAPVVYSYVRPHPEHRPSVTALLGLLGVVLIASPNWTSISIRGKGLELELLREMQARQLRAHLQANPRAIAAPTPRPAPDARRRNAAAPALAPGASPLEGPEAAPEKTPARSQGPNRTDELFESFSRGELDLRQLSDEQLLALNSHVTEHGERRAQR
jgi:hypothetical protein